MLAGSKKMNDVIDDLGSDYSKKNKAEASCCAPSDKIWDMTCFSTIQHSTVSFKQEVLSRCYFQNAMEWAKQIAKMFTTFDEISSAMVLLDVVFFYYFYYLFEQ